MPSMNDSKLFSSVHNGDVSVLRGLLEKGYNPNVLNDDGQSLLAESIFYIIPRQLEVIDLLLQYGAEVGIESIHGTTPVFHCMTREIAERLVEKGADINHRDKRNSTPLHNFVYFGSDLVEYAILCGADVNAQDKLGWTPLMCLAKTEGATTEDNIEIFKSVELLLKAGADINAVDMEGNDAIGHSLAVDVENERLSEFLTSKRSK
jgi:ankyrin repeat protein